MAQIPFEVENVVTISGRGVYVLSRCLGSPTFGTLAGASLGGCAIEPWTDMSRSLSSDGDSRVDLFAFVLRDPHHAKRFSPGQQVGLEVPAV